MAPSLPPGISSTLAIRFDGYGRGSVKYALLGLVGGGTLYGIHRLALWAERRGWIYYRKKHGSSGTLSNALLEVHSLFDPSKRYVLEEKERDQIENDELGDPPTTPGKRKAVQQCSGRSAARIELRR